MSLLTNSNSIIDNIYYFLWLKKESGLKDNAFPIKIPDTIIMKGYCFLNWYFTSKKSGTILMRKDFQLTRDKIFEKFTKNVSKSGIVAYYICQKNEQVQMIKDSWIKPQSDDELVIQYFTKEQFKDFLYEEESKENPRPPRGILQKFIDPFGDNQTIIQSVWSPQLCVFSKRLNYKYLYDQRWDPYERLVTFDGAEVYSRTVPLRGKQVSQSIRSVCKIIADKVQHVSFENYKIARMVLYFKPDKDNKLHFLYCSGIRLVNERLDDNLINIKKMHHTPLILEGSQFKKPDNVKLVQTTNTMRPVKLLNDIQCLNCKQKIQKSDLVSVDYKFIIETLEEQLINQYKTNIEVFEVMEEKHYTRQELKKEYVKSSAYEMPELIRTIYPKMTVEMYQQLSKHKHFLSKQIQLCQNCYEQFVSKDPISGVENKGVEDLKFIKKGMAKKKPLFTREIKCIVAQKNKELAEENFSKHQQPHTYQSMVDKFQEEITRNQLEKNDKENRKEQVDKFYAKINYQPTIQDKINKVKKIINRQMPNLQTPQSQSNIAPEMLGSRKQSKKPSQHSLVRFPSGTKYSKTQLDVSKEEELEEELNEEEMEERKLEQNHIYQGQRRRDSSSIQFQSIHSPNNMEDSAQIQRNNAFLKNKSPRIQSATGYSQTSTKAFSKQMDNLSQSHKHNNLINNTMFTDFSGKNSKKIRKFPQNQPKAHFGSSGQILKRPQTSLLVKSPQYQQQQQQNNYTQQQNIGRFFKESIENNNKKEKKIQRVQTAHIKPLNNQHKQSHEIKLYDNSDFNNTVDSQEILYNNSNTNQQLSHFNPSKDQLIQEINNDKSDNNFNIRNQQDIQLANNQYPEQNEMKIFENNYPFDDYGDAGLTEEQKLIDQQLYQQQQQLEEEEHYQGQQGEDYQQNTQEEQMKNYKPFQKPFLLKFSEQDFKDMNDYTKDDEKKKKKKSRGNSQLI